MKEIVKDLFVLADRSEEVNVKEDSEVQTIVNDIRDFLDENKDISYITAPQLGYKKRIFGLKFADGIKFFANPIISKSEGLHLSREKDISVGDFKEEYIIPRSDRVIVTYQTVTGALTTNKFEGSAAEIVQHEIDLLDGVTLNDYGLLIDEDFDKATDEERQEVLDYYINYLKTENQKYQEEIQNNPELKKSYDAIKFMTAVKTGKVELMAKPKGPQQQKALNKIARIKNDRMLKQLKLTGKK